MTEKLKDSSYSVLLVKRNKTRDHITKSNVLERLHDSVQNDELKTILRL